MNVGNWDGDSSRGKDKRRDRATEIKTDTKREKALKTKSRHNIETMGALRRQKAGTVRQAKQSVPLTFGIGNEMQISVENSRTRIIQQNLSSFS